MDLSPGIAKNHNLKLVKKEYQWEKIHETASYIMVPSSEVESAYFVNYPRLGSCFIRVGKLLSTYVTNNSDIYSYQIAWLYDILFNGDSYAALRWRLL